MKSKKNIKNININRIVIMTRNIMNIKMMIIINDSLFNY